MERAEAARAVSKNAGGEKGMPNPDGDAPWLDAGAAVPPWDAAADAESWGRSGSIQPPS